MDSVGRVREYGVHWPSRRQSVERLEAPVGCQHGFPSRRLRRAQDLQSVWVKVPTQFPHRLLDQHKPGHFPSHAAARVSRAANRRRYNHANDSVCPDSE